MGGEPAATPRRLARLANTRAKKRRRIIMVSLVAWWRRGRSVEQDERPPGAAAGVGAQELARAQPFEPVRAWVVVVEHRKPLLIAVSDVDHVADSLTPIAAGRAERVGYARHPA